jgi:hypothetical protein
MPFDANTFSTALKDLSDLCDTLYETSGSTSRGGGFFFTFRVDGTGIPDNILHAFRTMQDKNGASHHKKLQAQNIIDNELPGQLEALTSAYRSASGGLYTPTWAKAAFIFSPFSKGMEITYQCNSIERRDTRVMGGSFKGVQRAILPGQSFDPMCAMMEEHSKLDLEGPIQNFWAVCKGPKNNISMPYVISAPDIQSAIARVGAICDIPPEAVVSIKHKNDT